MRVAVIDCGTNTFNLLVADFAETSFEVIHASKVAVKIGKGGINNCLILPDAMDRAMKALVQHRKTIDELGAVKVLVFATSAVRSADNKDEFITRAKAEADLDVTVISGQQEARLIYEGVRHSGSLNDKTCLLMDIGGGSCEFIVCNKDEAFAAFSFEIGVSRLIDKFSPGDPMLPSEVDDIRQFLDHTLQPLFEQTAQYKPQFLVGSSGTFDTFTDILLAAKGITGHKPTEFSYTLGEFDGIYDRILLSTLKERLGIPGMAAFRAEMITASVIAVKAVTDHYRFSQITSSAFSLKEGILFALRDGLIEN